MEKTQLCKKAMHIHDIVKENYMSVHNFEHLMLTELYHKSRDQIIFSPNIEKFDFPSSSNKTSSRSGLASKQT